ncbi:MAG TPA: tRNA (adenosine(37)-N6)-dimethylallyltransferase MiaA [Caulobacteraceae bacterium]|nr:tRNA (adenosine(37)-N6)-dimethylallyltransferase MiaA [Caulobacteraceae bacterium]
MNSRRWRGDAAKPAGPSVWLIGGPTAGGKSTLALRLAEATGGEIVNADSMQVYRDLRLLTARPTGRDEARAPHHLYGIADAADAWSAGRWLAAAREVLAVIAGRGRVAVVVGGTGLYFRALTGGLAEIPASPAGVRAEVQEDWRRLGEAEFRERLGRIDPVAATRIAPGDRQRLTRALEVVLATGVPLNDFHRRAPTPLPPTAWRGVVVDPPRAVLYARCETRLETMLATGALDEVRALIGRDLDPQLPVMKALGVREFAEHLAGRATLAEALARARQSTRRYVKRQTTWFRHQSPDWPRIGADDEASQWEQFRALASP